MSDGTPNLNYKKRKKNNMNNNNKIIKVQIILIKIFNLRMICHVPIINYKL